MVYTDVDRRLINILEQRYPDKKVISLQNDSSLYVEVRTRANNYGMAIKEYIKFLGFTYERKKRKVNIEEVLEKLKAYYPNKIYDGQSEIQQKDQSLYKDISTYARNHGITFGYLLQEHGFFSVSDTHYDIPALQRMKQEYNMKLSDLAQWLGVSRQNLEGKLKDPKKKNMPWQGETLSVDEIKIIQSMVKRETTIFEDEFLRVKIYRNVKNANSCMIFIQYMTEQKVKVFFEFDEELEQLLIENNYNILEQADFEIKKEIEQLGLIEKGKVKITSEYPKLNTKINGRINRMKEFGGKEKYINLLGYEYLDGNYITDNEYKGLLKEYIDPDTGYVQISTKDSFRHSIAGAAKRRGYLLKDFIEHLGFKYKRRTPEKEYKERIQKYIVQNKEVYIRSGDPFYLLLFHFSKRNNMTINELINKWGYERIYKEDLPKGFTPYDYTKDEIVEISEDIPEFLDELVIDEKMNMVFIDPKTIFHEKLLIKAKESNMTLKELLAQWGYTLSPIEEKNGQDYIQDQVGRLKDIQGKLDKSTFLEEKWNRNKKLVREMKKLYKYRCQLCSKEERKQIPRIEKEDGTFYVEVHHIISVSDTDEVTDDSKRLIDSYKNVVVVCPHHHKMLHYHLGGYENIIDLDGSTYFKGKKENLLKIYTNHHLT